ncbi:Deoxynucleoside kinase [Aduncisulcus paluster]|uniref:Deoxynucleoside kinase n=1 Tax=Aduncisulcus paluster TaxID=2918883 RepID=A0ABQ5JSI8_9EUKA|nr:Deoxynucleoside kinase [Aduncisulcus paluster]
MEPEPLEGVFDNVFIAISGLIGAGKSTLAKALGEELGLPIYYEPVADNEYLEDFYRDTAKYSFAMQVYLLNKRFEQHQQIIWSGKGGVQDRTIYEDSVFAKMLADSGLMEKRDYATYQSLFKHMSNFMRKPNFIVHLDVTPEQSMERIKMRARGCEVGISLEYLKNLDKAYQEFLEDISLVIPVIKVKWSDFKGASEVAHALAREFKRIGNIRYVSWESGSPSGSPIIFAPKKRRSLMVGKRDKPSAKFHDKEEEISPSELASTSSFPTRDLKLKEKK